jgi:nucleoside-diphosphate-sugar epimerase
LTREAHVRCFVTGATGFIGTRVVALLKQHGHEVSVLARDPAKAEKLGIPRERVVVGDLFTIALMKEAIKGADAVIHLAAEIATQRDPKKLWRIDVEGTDAMIDACEGTGVGRFVFASTVVVGDPKGALLHPDDPLEATTVYGKAKQEAERRLKKSGLPVVIVRPSHVYGPGGWYKDLVADFRAGKAMIPGWGDNYWDTVHVDDVASALVLVTEEADPGSTFHAVDDVPIPMREFFNVTADALRVARPWSVPVFLAKLVKGSGPIDAAIRSARSDNARLKAIGWTLRHPNARDGIYDVIRELEGPLFDRPA